jgi:hypothetical protein
MFDFLINKLRRHQEPEPDKPVSKCRWVIDLPTIEGQRLGPFRTKEEALDYRREYIIRKLTETNTAEELPF